KQSFETPDSVRVRVDNRAGPVWLRARPGTTTEVDVSAHNLSAELLEYVRVEHDQHDKVHRVVVDVPPDLPGWSARGAQIGGHRLRVMVPGLGDLLRSSLGGYNQVQVTISVPEGAALDVVTASGDVTADGRFGDSTIETRSGHVQLGSIDGNLSVKSQSGDVNVRSVSGDARVNTASGDVRCGPLGAAQVRTASGDVEVGATTGLLSVQTASGDVVAGQVGTGCDLKSASGDQRVESLVSGRAVLETVSGDITVGIARASLLAVDAETVSGDLTSEIDLDQDRPGEGWDGDGPRVELRARTVSGDLHIQRAPR
ncbi:MAG TPA: DUF4097 family beta strand repeat-containing protein, partial [Acidimicrobiales bacterium]|nr:DUF4097 family beta strand repeat-containing protein [Acidimicrobiales bacterium]